MGIFSQICININHDVYLMAVQFYCVIHGE